MSKNSKEIRLQKFIADCGVTSRRKAEDLIVQGRVNVNGQILTELGTKVDPEADAVMVDGQAIDLKSVRPIYVLLHKPRGYVTTLHDPEGRDTVMDFVREIPERIYPVGRLDYLSEGLLLMTNDGEVANMVMHPKFEVYKVYEVKVFGAMNETLLKKLRAGVVLEEGFTKPKSVRVIKQLPTKTWLEFRLGEGKNREIRKICEACGLTVDKLKRVAIGGITVEGIRPGGFRYINKKDVMEGLGLTRDGKKVRGPIEYISPKKTVNLKKRKKQQMTCTPADDENFTKFRRENYFETLKKLKLEKERKIEQEKAASFEEKEKAHQERKLKKMNRQAEKERQQKERPIHAKFEK